MKNIVITLGLALIAGQAQASIMSLVESKDKLAVISAHEIEAKRDYDAAKIAYKRQKQARKAAAKEVKAIIKANTTSIAAEKASVEYGERARHFNPYLDENQLGSGFATIREVQ